MSEKSSEKKRSARRDRADISVKKGGEAVNLAELRDAGWTDELLHDESRRSASAESAEPLPAVSELKETTKDEPQERSAKKTPSGKTPSKKTPSAKTPSAKEKTAGKKRKKRSALPDGASAPDEKAKKRRSRTADAEEDGADLRRAFRKFTRKKTESARSDEGGDLPERAAGEAPAQGAEPDAGAEPNAGAEPDAGTGEKALLSAQDEAAFPESENGGEREPSPAQSAKRPIRNSHLLGVLLGYEKSAFSLRRSRPVRFLFDYREFTMSGRSGSLPAALKRSSVRRFFAAFSHLLACTAANAYGVFLLAFGALTLFLNFAAYYLGRSGSSPLAALITGAVAILLAAPLLFSAQPLARFLQSHDLTDRLLFEIFCFPRVRCEEGDRKIPGWLTAIFGGILALLGFIFPLFRVLLIFAAVTIALLSAASPEFPLLLTLLFLPLFPLAERDEWILAIMTGLSLISFLLKTLVGKRVFRVSAYEMMILLMLPLLLIAGQLHGNVSAAAIAAIPLLSYMLTVSLTANRRIADSAADLLILSSLPTAGYGVLRYLLDLLGGVRAEKFADCFFLPAFGEATGYLRASSSFKDPDVFAAFLRAAIAFAVFYATDRSRSKAARAFAWITAALDFCALILTFSHAAWIALLLLPIVLPILRSPKANRLWLLPFSLIPAIPLFMPESLRLRILSAAGLSDAPIARRVAAMDEAFAGMRGNLFTGVGDATFLADNGSISSAHAPLFFQLILSVGIPVTAILLLLLCYRALHLTKFARYLAGSSMHTPALASQAALFLWITCGSAVYLFIDCTMLYLFCVVCGIGAAALRISRAETLPHG